MVVPTDYGGIGRHGTFDGSAGRVSDISSTAMRQHRRLEFQLHEAPPAQEDASLEEQVDAWIAEDESRSILRAWTWIDIGRRWLFVSELPNDPDDDGPTFQRRRVSLESHLNGVSARTRDVAKRLGLQPAVINDLALAARLHDVGKLDDRFQRLCGRKPDADPLAQSGHSWIERRRRAALSDYPKGERHEALSVELIIRHGLHETADDSELVEHLVASHHGWARPFVRAARGVACVKERLFRFAFDDELAHSEAERAPARYRSVQERFGWLGLAWLEAIVQLSDHQQVKAQNRGELAPVGGEPLHSRQSEAMRTTPLMETALTALNGLVPGDYLAALGVLRALDVANEHARLRWQGTQPRLTTTLGIDGIVDRLVNVRGNFRGNWPAELNKMSEDQREELLLSAGGPFRSLVVALLSPGGRSEMDFVSGGRSGFKSIFEWSTTAQAKAFSSDDLRRALVGPRALAKGGKSFRWSPLAAQGARRPQSASNDKRCEPWIEWLALMGVSRARIRAGGASRPTCDALDRCLRSPVEQQAVPVAALGRRACVAGRFCGPCRQSLQSPGRALVRGEAALLRPRPEPHVWIRTGAAMLDVTPRRCPRRHARLDRAEDRRRPATPPPLAITGVATPAWIAPKTAVEQRPTRCTFILLKRRYLGLEFSFLQG